MRYVAIIKTVADLGENVSELYKGLPSDYPIQCKEYETEAEAKEHYPACAIMTVDHYRGYSDGMNMLYRHVKESESKQPWWKFW